MRKVLYLMLCILIVGSFTACSKEETVENTEATYNPTSVVYKTDEYSITSEDVVNMLELNSGGILTQYTKDDEDLSEIRDYTYDIVYRLCYVQNIAKGFGKAEINEYYNSINVIKKGLNLDTKDYVGEGALFLVCFDGYSKKDVLAILNNSAVDYDTDHVSYELYRDMLITDEIDAYKNKMKNGISDVFYLNDEDTVLYALVDTSIVSIPRIGLDKDTYTLNSYTTDIKAILKDLEKDFALDDSCFDDTVKEELNNYIGENYNYSSKRKDFYDALALELGYDEEL